MPELLGGVFISFEPERRKVLRERSEWPGRFSVELSASDWPPFAFKSMFLLSLSDDRREADCAAIARTKRGPHNTNAYNVEFSDFVFFRPIRISALRAELPPPARAAVKEREGDRGLWFPPKAWLSLLDVLKAKRPTSAQPIDELWRRVNAREPIGGSRLVERLALQRDAIGLSLDVAGLSNIRREELRKARPIGEAEELDSFITLMDSQRPQERSLIEHDRSVFEGAIADGRYQTMNFSEGRRTIRVWTVDRHKIERFAGVDLVILNRDYNSLLLVQYKCLEPRDEGSNDWRYRPDAQFGEELKRLLKIRQMIQSRMLRKSRMEDVRLNRGALYFKFCKRLPLAR